MQYHAPSHAHPGSCPGCVANPQLFGQPIPTPPTGHYDIVLFQPIDRVDSLWCADVYLPTPSGGKGERIHCGKGFVLATQALEDAGQFIVSHRVNALLAKVAF